MPTPPIEFQKGFYWDASDEKISKLEYNEKERLIEEGDEWYWEADEIYETGDFAYYTTGAGYATTELIGPLFNPEALIEKTPEQIIQEMLS